MRAIRLATTSAILFLAAAPAAALDTCALLRPEAQTLLGVPPGVFQRAPDPRRSCAALSADRMRAASLEDHGSGSGAGAILQALRRDETSREYKDLRDEPDLGPNAYSVMWANGQRLIFRAVADGRMLSLTVEIGHEPTPAERDAARDALKRIRAEIES